MGEGSHRTTRLSRRRATEQECSEQNASLRTRYSDKWEERGEDKLTGPRESVRRAQLRQSKARNEKCLKGMRSDRAIYIVGMVTATGKRHSAPLLPERGAIFAARGEGLAREDGFCWSSAPCLESFCVLYYNTATVATSAAEAAKLTLSQACRPDEADFWLPDPLGDPVLVGFEPAPEDPPPEAEALAELGLAT